MYYVEDYHDPYLVYEQKGISKLNHNFNDKNSKFQSTSHRNYFDMRISEHTNGLDFITECA